MARNLWSALPIAALVIGSAASPVFAQEDFFINDFDTVAEQNLWAVKETAVDRVADLGVYGAGVKVAVLDSGITFTTPGINNKVVAYKDFLPSQQPLPDHGTQSAGIISSDYDAATGIRGVAPNASLIIGRVCHMSYCDTEAIRYGIAWAVEQGAQVINMSFGGSADVFMNAAITAAVNQGVVVVASAGNNGCRASESWGMNRFCRQGVISEISPASFTIPGLISVGAIDRTRERAHFSSWGPNLDIMAPGVENATYDPVGPTNGFGGTSAAAPMVAGIAALILSVNPKLKPSQVQAILQSSTRAAPSVKPKVWDNCNRSISSNVWTCDNEVDNNFPQQYFTGAGIVNALNAVLLTQQLSQGQLLAAPTTEVNQNQIKLTWLGGPAALYSNNKLLAPNAASGFTVSGEYAHSYAFHLKRFAVLSEPKLVVLQRQIIPAVPDITEINARSNSINIRTTIAFDQMDQLDAFSREVAAIFEFDNGRQIGCSGYSPSTDVTNERPFAFSCPLTNLSGPVTGSFRIVNKYSQAGPSAPVFIPFVSQAEKLLEVSTTYTSSETVIFDWDDVPGALSYTYRFLPMGQLFCTTESQYTVRGKSIQPSVFWVEAVDALACAGNRIIQSEYLPFVVLSAKPKKPEGVTVKSNEFSFVEFSVVGAKATDEWRIYRSDGEVARIAQGQSIAMGTQARHNVNGKSFSYRIMQVKNDTWGEVWSEPSEPIVVSIRELAAPSSASCYSAINQAIICSLRPNSNVESTLLEYLDYDGVVIRSIRVNNNAQTISQRLVNPLAAAFVRVSGLTGRTNEWMRRGNAVTVGIQFRATSKLTHSVH